MHHKLAGASGLRHTWTCAAVVRVLVVMQETRINIDEK
jgi:hypothetical protein